MHEAQRLGADYYVQKPINFDGFVELASLIATAAWRGSATAASNKNIGTAYELNGFWAIVTLPLTS